MSRTLTEKELADLVDMFIDQHKDKIVFYAKVGEALLRRFLEGVLEEEGPGVDRSENP